MGRGHHGHPGHQDREDRQDNQGIQDRQDKRNRRGQTKSEKTDRTDRLTFRLDFPGNLCRAAFAILAMFLLSINNKILDNCSALQGHRAFEALGGTILHIVRVQEK